MRRDGEPVWIEGEVLTPLQRLTLGRDEGSVSEDWLQKQLFEAPGCVQIEAIERGITAPLRSVCREFPTPHGPIDNLFMTSQGDIVIAEVKLWRNPEARRKVVAQALDYASCLFQMSYSEFEQAALAGILDKRTKPRSLYELVAGPNSRGEETLDEPEFIDQVSRNLKRGNIVVLVVGDGIRESAEQLAGTLQAHAMLRFTFALIEMSIYTLAGRTGRLLLPRTLARTQMIERGVISIVEGKPIAVEAQVSALAEPKPVGAGGITEDQFFAALKTHRSDAVAKIKELLQLLAPLGVEPVFMRGLNLKVETRYGTVLNLFTIQKDGQVFIDASNRPQLQPMGEEYHQLAARALGCEVVQSKSQRLMKFNGGWPVLDQVLDRLPGIVEPARAYIAAIEARDAQAHSAEGERS